jgi:serine/threonine protein phosphatase PrpC
MSQATVGAVCAVCGTVAGNGARFCEACGSDLPGVGSTAPAAPGAPGPAGCRECGAAVDPDGYCTSCGAKAPGERDHVVEQPQPWVGAVSDRGLRHDRNEDAMAVDAGDVPGGHAVLVVCDGVSMSQDSDIASLAAARAACDVLVGSRALGTDSGIAVLGGQVAAAVEAASRAVAQVTLPDHGSSPPSCTFVAAVVDRGRVVTGVVGDSRAYWLPDAGEARVLTVDDSWAAVQIAAGVPRDQAESGPQAHALTRWLGVDGPDHAPRVTTMLVQEPGWLVLCSDGLWNYCSPAGDLAALVQRTAAAAAGDPLATASALVDWANGQGGRDNITVVLARLVPDLDSGPAASVSSELQTGSST